MKSWSSMSDAEKLGLISAVIVVVGDAVALLALLVDSGDNGNGNGSSNENGSSNGKRSSTGNSNGNVKSGIKKSSNRIYGIRMK